MRPLFLLLSRSITFFSLSVAIVGAQDGATIYKQHCAGCHDAPGTRVPPLSALRAMDAPSILRSLETGLMKTQGAALTANERYAVVGYLAAPVAKTAAPPPSAALCSAQQQQSSSIATRASWTLWGVNSANTRFQNSAAAGLTAEDVPKLKLKWAFGLGDGNETRSQPAVEEGHIFLANLTGSVYSLEAHNGCIQWTFQADGPVRTGIVFGPTSSSAQRAVYFGDVKGNAYAVDAATGKLLWKAHPEDHFAAIITGAPQLHNGVLYVPVASYEEALAPSPGYSCCTFRGSVSALDAATGKRLWKTYTIAEPPHPTEKKAGTQLQGPSGASVWSTPTFDDKLNAIYVATGDNYSDPPTKTSDGVLALDAKNGQMLWSRQLTARDAYNNGCATPAKTNCPEHPGADSDFGQPPILVSLSNGHRALVLGQKSGMVHALDPDRQGEILWQTRVGQGGPFGGIQWGSAADTENVYAAVSDLQITVALDSSAPQGYSLGVDPNRGGGLFAMKLSTGEKVWSAKPGSCDARKHCSPAQSAAVTAIPGVVFSGSVDGHLRAYAARSGDVIWDVDTGREYETVNGQKARGGSIDGAGGPVIAGGMLYVNSGYGQWGGAPGNVFLAFGVDGK
ncbi:MAG: PQQ-binding-like beta-propeller repeat protein [Acidobacteriaceae bacterium]|nr:PQQ-binding-like beta-propeller repeat protein [Acidobacteriaceae bacterium]MBV9499482.1 PQQ-binding-like beta-propeller repeat protein [Acidobacteriaceae bacterium]